MQKSELRYTSYGKKRKWYQLKRFEIISILVVLIAVIIAFIVFKQPINYFLTKPSDQTPGMGINCSSSKGGDVCEPAYEEPPEQVYDGFDTTLPVEGSASNCSQYLSVEECRAQGFND